MQKESRRYYRLRMYSNLRQRKLSTVLHDSEKLSKVQVKNCPLYLTYGKTLVTLTRMTSVTWAKRFKCKNFTIAVFITIENLECPKFTYSGLVK